MLRLFDAILYGVISVAGAALFVGPFTRSGRTSPHWTRVALWICGPVASAWGVLGLTLVFAAQSLAPNEYRLIVHFKTLLAGMGIGILVLLFVSGEFTSALAVLYRRRTSGKG